MRCGTAAITALALHPDYQGVSWVREEAVSIAVREIEKFGDYTYVAGFPADWMRSVVEEHLPGLLKKQRFTGLWTIKDARRISYYALKALSHCDLLS